MFEERERRETNYEEGKKTSSRTRREDERRDTRKGRKTKGRERTKDEGEMDERQDTKEKDERRENEEIRSTKGIDVVFLFLEETYKRHRDSE